MKYICSITKEGLKSIFILELQGLKSLFQYNVL